MMRTLYHSIKHLFTKVTAPSQKGRGWGMVCPIIILFFTLNSSLLTFTSCSSETEEPEVKSTPVQIMSYMEDYTPYESHETHEAHPSLTRTESWMPYGFQSDDSHNAIGAFFTSALSTSEAHRFWYNRNDSKWFIDGKEINPGAFYLYGYMPYNAANVTIAPNTVEETTSYEKGAILTFTNMDCVATKDICVLTGAKEGTLTGVTDLHIGQFGVNMKSGGAGQENYLYLLFEHIYARLDFAFRVANEGENKYASLRTIKLKHLELKAYSYTSDTHSDTILMNKTGSLEVHLKANTDNKSPIDNDIRFTPDPGAEKMDPVVLFDSEVDGGEVTLPSEADTYTTKIGYVPYFNFANSNTKVLYKLHSIYDVYDKNVTSEHPDGNLIRRNCTADNVIVPKNLFGLTQLECGKKYTLKLTVAPTYLYVLSEPDLDNPSVTLD